MSAQKAYVVGLTGGIACGKTNLSDTLRNAGVPVVDADAISRAITAPNGEALPLLFEAFGKEIFDGEQLNRKALGALVFFNADALKKLNSLLHPLILSKIRTQIDAFSASGARIVFLDAPLLYETGLDGWCDEVWCAYLPKKEQMARLRARNGLTKAQANARIQSQMPARERKARADRVIDTRGSKENSAALVLSMYEALVASLTTQKEISL